MFRTLVLTVILAAVLAPTAHAQSWARKMFTECDSKLSHDFGVVAKGSDTIHEFEFKNLFKEDVHIAAVRSSCRCTVPTVTQKTVKTWEKSAIRAVFNTKTYTGRGSATLTVIIDKPFYAEVQLSVRGYIRSDVLFTPGSVAFGDVEAGQVVERQVKVDYSGRSSWDIVDVRSANPHFEVELNNRQGKYGRVTYTMTVRLKDDAPVGYVHDQLTIVTNDSLNRSLELPVEGRVISALTVSPQTLFMGILKPGEVAKRPVFVRGSKPFKITAIKCPDGCFQFVKPESSKASHLIPITFTAGEQPGKVSETVEIQTDRGTTATCVVTATVEAPAPAGDAPVDVSTE